MAKRVNVKPCFFQAIIDGRLNFAITTRYGAYKPGDKVILEEWKGKRIFGDCPQNRQGCWAWREIEAFNEENNANYGEEEAIDWCGKNRCHCDEYEEDVYTGADCLVKIKEVFDLGRVNYDRFWEYIGFTFEILNIRRVVEERKNDEK